MVQLIGYDLKEVKVDYETTKKYRINLMPIKEGEKISIISDSMFHTMFYHQKRIKYSAKFFSYIIDVPYKELLKKVKLVKSELDKDKVYQKGERCDYVAEINRSLLNLEVNTNPSHEILERNMEYAFRLYRKLSRLGSNHEYRQVIQVNLNNFCYKNNNKSVDVFTLNNKDGTTLSNKIIIINIYLPNIRKKCYTNGIESLNEFERYILVLSETNIRIAQEIAEGDLFMQETIKEQNEFCLGEDLKESYNHELAYGEEMKRTGYDEGVEKGQLTERQAIFKSLLDNGMTIEELSEKTGISIDDIKQIID